jgi:murein DD-endopeptidase MepM/ murein hydrolase activator NlpD
MAFIHRRGLGTEDTSATAAAARTPLGYPTEPQSFPSRRQVRADIKARGPKKFRKGMFAKLGTTAAMFGAAALLIASSLPASAVHGGSSAEASTLSPTTVTQAKTQTMAVSTDVVASVPTRDAYTVVSPQIIKAQYTSKNFDYTNDTAGTVQWPFPVAVPISSGFGPRVAPCRGCSSFHEGVDFVPGSGVEIHSIADGVVSEVSTSGAYGNHVIVDYVVNGVALQALYAHMIAGSIQVTVGEPVTVTQVLGQVGRTGEATGAHLHLEIHIDNVPVDPFAWLKANAN